LNLFTRFSVLIYILYFAITIFYILYKISTTSEINICIENLFLINTIFLYTTIYLSILVNTLEISLSNLRYIYNSVKFITKAFATIYIDLSATIDKKNLIDLLFQIFELTIRLLLYIEKQEFIEIQTIVVLVLLLFLLFRLLCCSLYKLFLQFY